MINNQNCLFVRFNWDHSALPYDISIAGVTFKDLHIQPSARYPVGQKGMALAHYWNTMQLHRTYHGILILDGDVAIDPGDLSAMLTAIEEAPLSVLTTPMRVWYDGREYWSHRGRDGELHNGPIQGPIHYFSFGFTYIPRELMTKAVNEGLALQVYPYVDEWLSKYAVKWNFAIELITGCYPKHMHF